MEQKQTTVINIFGAPGAGKSTLAFDLCARLKREGFVTEFTGEAAKEQVWENPDRDAIPYQLHLFAEQQKRIDRLLGKVDLIVTDSPAPNFLWFDTTGNVYYQDLVMAEFHKTRNINLVCERKFPYEKEGRSQSEKDATILGEWIIDLLDDYEIEYLKTDSLAETAPELADHIKNCV